MLRYFPRSGAPLMGATLDFRQMCSISTIFSGFSRSPSPPPPSPPLTYTGSVSYLHGVDNVNIDYHSRSLRLDSGLLTLTSTTSWHLQSDLLLCNVICFTYPEPACDPKCVFNTATHNGSINVCCFPPEVNASDRRLCTRPRHQNQSCSAWDVLVSACDTYVRGVA